MSDILKPTDFGLPEVPITRYRKPRLCRLCDDEFLFYRWGGNNYCPDCDIKRMKRVDDGMKAIAEKLKPKKDARDE